MQAKPKTVWIGVVLLWASVLYSAAVSLVQLPRLLALQSPVAPLLYAWVPLFLVAVLTWCIASGRGWARYGLLALFVYGQYRFWMSFGVMLQHFRDQTMVPWVSLGGVLSGYAVHTVLRGAALILLFMGSARDWFAARNTNVSDRAFAAGRLWLVLGFCCLLIGWVAYPVNMMALMLAGAVLGFGPEDQGLSIVWSGLLYSVALFAFGSVAGLALMAARNAGNVPTEGQTGED